MTYSEMKRNRKALEREQTVDKYEKPMTYSEMKPISNIRNGKDTLFDDIAAFRKNAVGENAFNKYYSHGFKTADDYTAASDYLNSSVASLKDYRERLEKNRSAYERVYGTDAVKQMEDYISKASAIYSDQGLWDELSRRRDSFAEYDSAESYDAATDMTNGEGQKLDSLIAAAQEKYDNASSNRSYSFLDWINKINGGHVPEDVETNYAKSELERLKQLKLDWENNRADYDDDGNPFALKYDGADYKTLSLAEHKLAVREYELSDSEKRELAWLKNNKKHYATTEELENELALKEGQAKNAQAEAERIRYNEVAKVPTSNEDVNFQSTAIINGDSPSANSAIKYTAEASTLKNYYNERKADEQLEKLQQEIYDKYMPLLDDPEFLKHSEVEKDKESDVYFGADNTTDVYNNPANMYNVKMTDKERSVFYGLYNTDKNRAAEFLDELTPVLNKRMTDTVTQVVQEDTQDNPYMHSALAVLSNLASGISSVEDTWNGMTGKGIDTNSPSHLLSRYTSTVRGTTSQMLDDYLKKNPDSVWNTKFALAGRDENGNYRSLGLFAKETAESIMDNLARMAVTKGIGAAAGGGEGISKAALETIDFTLMGSQVASQTIIDAKEKGLSDGKALAMGFTSGAIEAITEIWSVEKVLKDPKSFIGTLGKSLIAEGSEEISSNILNRAVDVLVNADQSEVMQEYYGYINEGLSPSEASAKTITGILGDDLSAGLGGALSGLVMTGGNYNMAKAVEINESAKRGIKQIQVGNRLKTSDSVITALDEIIKANPENTQAIEAKAAIEKGEKVSARKLGKLLSDEVSNQFEKAYTVDRNEIKTKLEAKGVENADSLSETIAKAFNEGIDSVKGKERTALTHNADAMAVYNEYRTAQTTAAENADRLTLAYSTAGREQLLNYAKEQGRNSGFLQEAADLAEGKTDLDSAIDLQTAVETEIADRFLSANTVEEAQEVFKELSNGAGKDITAILKDSLDTRTDDILAESKYDKVTNVSFKNTRDGVAAYVTTKNGENLSPFAANIGSESAAVINRATAKPAEARTLYATEYFNGNNYLAASSYDRAFTKYYEAGKKGTSFADIKRSTRDIKGDSARRIYEAGRKAAAAETKRQIQYRQTDEYKNRSEARTEANTKAEKSGGVVRDYSADRKVNKNQRGQLRLLDEWAKQKGVVIRVVGSLAEKLKLEDQIINGQYAGGNVIVIALDGKNMLTSTAGHELFHMIKNLAAEYAEDFTAFVIDHLKESGQYESVFNDYARRYGMAYANDESFKAKIEEEIVAEHCFEALTNKEQWEKFAGEHKSIAEKIIDFIKEFVAMINNAFDKYFVHDNAYIRNSVMSDVDYMNKIADMLWTGVDEAVENYRFGAGTEGETRFKLIDKTADGIEVYETSDETKALTEKERKKQYLSLMRNEYAGRTARFVRNGHTYYAEFDRSNYKKPIYGEKHNSRSGYNALLRAGADGDVFDLVENSEYSASRADDKNHKAKDGFTDYFDYFVKTVQIDDRFYDLTATVKKKYGEKNGYTYSLFLKDNKKIKASSTKGVKPSQLSKRPLFDTNISQNDTDVNTHSMKKPKKYSSFSISDEEYMSAAESGDTRLAQRMVNEAAGEAGYNSPVLYHGTQNFGFTEFDLNKMGDGRSIFLTSSRDIASTYSGVGGKRNIETPKSSANMTIDEVAKALNEVAQRDNGDLELSSYRVMNQKDLTSLERSVDKGIEDLYDTVQKKIELYGEKLARDFNDKDEKTLNKLVDLSDLLEHYSYDKLSTPLYMLLHHTDAFTTEKYNISDLEADVRLMQLLKKNDLSKGIVVAESKDRYYIRALDKEKAAKLLDEQNALGNYALFAKLGNSLEIDGKGKNWNKIFAVLEPQEKTTLSAKYNTDTNTLVLSDEKGTFAEIKRDTLDEAAPAMARAITNRYGKFFAATVLSQARDQLKKGATAEVRVRAVGDRNTREIAEFADEQGYDSVVFRDLMDNGGQNSKVASSTTADIYIIFDPNNVKSADPITYDNDGNIIPLSERFNENEKDIRYSIADEERYNSLQKEYQELVTKSNEIKNSPEFEKLVDAISTKSGDALDEAIKEYGRFTHKSGLYAASKRMSEIIGEQKELRSRIDNDNAQSRDQFMKSVDNLSEKEKAEYVKNAEETFGTTDNVRLASYLLIDGEMLDFSEGQGYRVRDHREISEILDMPDSAEYSDSLIYFMNMGNIRMQTYGIDISAAPNAEQISRLRDVIPEIMKDNDEFSVDFSKKNGYSAGSVTYPKGTATSKILSDINEFFESGTVPVYESEYGEFRYSVSESFEEQVDGVLNNTFDKNNHIYMGNTPNSLQSILHLQNRPMLITPTHVYTMTVSEAQAKADGRYVKGRNYHDLGKDILLGLPKALEKPLFLIKSSAKQNDLRIIAVTSLTDKNGVNVVAAIEPDGKGKLYNMTLDSNVMLSGYGKSNVLNYVLNAKKEGRILYASEKNNRLGKSRPGVQFPDHAFTADYSNSLSQYRETVNKYYAQNDKEYLSNSNKYKNFELSDETKASISDAGMRLTDDAELSSLMRSNADYKAEIERLKGEFVKSKRMGGKGANRLVQTDINRVARNIIGEYSSEINFYDLKDELTGLYGFIANSEKNSWDYAYAVQAANNIAKSVIAQSFVDITPETFESYKKELRSHRLIPNLDDVAEMTAMFGTFGAAYRQYGKKLNMRAQGTENAVHIDEIWDDLCAAVPLLDKDAQSTRDMWRNLIEVRDSLDEKSGFNPYLGNDELSAEQSAAVLGADILERFYEISPDTTFADRAQQQVNIREQKISELKADKQEALKKLREQRDTKISELKESFRQQNQKRRERSSRTALRHKIKALTADMNRRLLYPKKNEYIPRELMSSVAGVLNAINLDSGKSAALSQKFSVLKSAYEAIQKSEKYQSAYDSTVADMIQNLVEKSSGKFTAVSKENLEYIYDTLKAVDKLCKDAIKVKIAGEEHNAKEFSKQLIKETRQAKDMGRLSQKYTFAQSRPEAVFERFGGFAKNSAWQKMYTLLNDGQLKKTSILIEGKRMFNELVEGKNKKNVDSLISINEKDLVDIGLVDSDGNSVKITRDMMNAVYMMLENEDNTRHLIYGGLTVPDLKGYYKGKNEAFGKGAVRAEIMQGKFVDEIHRIREQIETVKDSNAADKAEQLDELYEQRDLLVARAYSKAAEIKNKIAEQMTDYDRAWIAKAKEFFDGFSRDQMNAVTLAVYGFEKARIENYFPIHTDSAFRNEDFGVIQKAASLENMGFTKERVFSGSPIMLEGLTDVINGHIDDIANYAGLMPSVREFQKVYGKNMTDENGLTSVQNALREKFGTQGRKYISDLLGDITGSRQRSGSAFFNRIRGNMAQATLSVNARVALSQAASYPTAAAEIGWKPLTKALGMGLKKADKALIAEYSPLLAYRMAGYSNPEIGNIKDLGKTQNKVLKNTAWLMNWITQIDGATVGRLWYASQFYVDDNNSQLKAAFDKATAEHKANTISDEQFQKAKDDYYSEVAKVFNRVVERTQPNYTTMQRPAVLRSDKDLIRSMTMFYTQRLQNVSILYDAFSRMRSYSESYKNNPSGDVTAEDVKTARNEFGRAVFSQIVATTTLTAMKTIVDILLQSLYAYRDPDDDITPESFWGNVGYNFLDSFVSNLLFGSEMLKIAKAAYQIYDGSFSSRNADDFITIGGVETINDFTVYLEKFGDSFSKYVNGEGDLEDLGKSGLNLAKITGTLTGVPVANIGKLVEGIVSLGDKIAEGKSLLSSGENKKTGTSSKKNMDKYNAAYAKADSSAAKEAVRTMIEEEKQKLLENGADQYAVNSKGQNKVTLEAKQNVRNKFSNEYRDKYKQAYRNKDTKTVAEIKTKLSLTGLYDNLDDTLEKWRDSADEDANQEKRAKEYAERQK